MCSPNAFSLKGPVIDTVPLVSEFMASQRTFNRSYDDYKKVHFYRCNWNDIYYAGHLSVNTGGWVMSIY